MFAPMRRFKQQLEKDKAMEILTQGKTGVLALSGGDGWPYTVPINYAVEGENIYFHCAREGKKLRDMAFNPQVSLCVISKDDISAPDLTTYFESVIAFCRGEIVKDREEIYRAMDLLCRKYAPEYLEKGRMETNGSMNRLCVVRLSIQHITGKRARELMKG